MKEKAKPADCPPREESAPRRPDEPAAREGGSLLPPGSAAPTPDRAPELPSGTTAA